VQEIARLQRTKKLLVFVSGAFFISWIPLNMFNILSDTCSLLVMLVEYNQFIEAQPFLLLLSSY
jgi:hypothetical protein